MTLSQSNTRTTPVGRGKYSADVKLYLILEDGQRIALAQAGPDRVDLREPMVLPAGKAVVEVQVDGDIRRWDVTLAPEKAAAVIVPIPVA